MAGGVRAGTQHAQLRAAIAAGDRANGGALFDADIKLDAGVETRALFSAR